MKKVVLASLLIIGLGSCAPRIEQGQKMPSGAKSQTCQPITEAQVAGFFDRWNASLKTENPDLVTANYRRDGLLLPTVSNRPRANHEEIRAYFVDFLKKRPEGKIDLRFIRMACNVAIDAGVYTFKFNADGSTVTGRYTYVYEYENNQWLIASHHSSAMPKDVASEPWKLK